MIQARSLKF